MGTNPVTKSGLETISQQCIKNVKGLLTGVNLLLEIKETRKYALGLYMYAIEEFGKVMLLRDYIDNKKEDESELKSIFGISTSRRKEVGRGQKNVSTFQKN